MRTRRFLMTAVLFLGMAGCGEGIKRVPVQGKVTAKGVPIDGTVVQFIPTGGTKGEGGIGRSDPEGMYSLRGLQGAKGVVSGEYKIRLSRLLARNGTLLPEDADPLDIPFATESLPEKYTVLESTPLKYTVPEEGGTLNIDVPEGLRRGRK